MTDYRGGTHTHTHKQNEYAFTPTDIHSTHIVLVAISNYIRPCPTTESSGVLAGYKNTRSGSVWNPKRAHIYSEG